MIFRTSALVGSTLFLAAACDAATIRLITQAEIPASFPTVTFNSLVNSGTPATPPQSYSEAGVTVNGTLYSTTVGFNSPGDRWLAGPVGTYSFSYPVTKVGWQEFYGDIQQVSLFADAQGLVPLGTFSITTPYQVGSLRFHGFASDVQFQRMAFSTLRSDAYINNLQFTPEPTAFLSVCGGALAIAGRGLLSRRRQGA